MQVDWELSEQFVSDSQGIRAVCVLPRNNNADGFSLVAGNQGGGLCEFGVPSGSLNPIEYEHDHGVTALLSDESHYVTGCKDAVVRLFDGKTHSVKASLTGHEKPVTSLSFASTNENTKHLLSGSWDGTAKVWDVGRKAMVATLPGHENLVCVAGLNAEATDALSILRIATGSAGMAENNQISGFSVRTWMVDVNTGQWPGNLCQHCFERSSRTDS
jgi:WD40 repeat protein